MDMGNAAKKYENLAKTFYDIGKYTFTALVVGQFVSEKFNLIFMSVGAVFTIVMLWIAVRIDGIKEVD